MKSAHGNTPTANFTYDKPKQAISGSMKHSSRRYMIKYLPQGKHPHRFLLAPGYHLSNKGCLLLDIAFQKSNRAQIVSRGKLTD